jgi:diguanylate cyclase (GGDEF)-like protein/PAS domain S-box-containing protein
MPTDRRTATVAIVAIVLTIGSGVLVFGGTSGRPWLAVLGALCLVVGSVTLAWALARQPATGAVASPPPPLALFPAAVPAPAPPVEVPLFERLSDPVFLVDRAGTVLHASASTARVLGHIPDTLHGRPLSRLVHEDDLTTLAPFLREVADGEDPNPPPRWRVRRGDGGWQAIRASATSLLDEQGIEGIAIVLRDDASAATLADLPTEPQLRDTLTGLATRALFRDRVEHALARGQRRQQPLAVVLLEFDDFRCHGSRATYEELEHLLSAAATRIHTCLRSSDSAARIEGTQFGILLEELSDDRHVARVTERLARLFTAPLTVGGRDFIASGNIGIANAVPEGGAEDLLRNVGVALRAARRRGRGAVELFDATQHAAPLGHQHLHNELRRAIEGGNLTLLYQPIVILRSRRIAGVEALVRWRHPDRGIIPAAAFIPVAEESGLIVPLGQWVLREACRQLSRWHAEIGPERAITVTVNLTARQLLEPGLTDDVREVLATTMIDPSRLVFEIAEHVFARHVHAMQQRVRELRAFGVRFALDEFGSRGTALGDPADIPVDIIKIDRTYISQLARRPEDHAATRAIVALARLKQLRTVAPGIESEEQVAELLRFRCEYGQGTLFSEPLDADHVLRLLRHD